MYNLDRFRTHPLQRPPKQEIDLTLSSSSAVPGSPGVKQRVAIQDLGMVSPGIRRRVGDPPLISQRTIPRQRGYNKAQVSEADRMFKLKLVETCAEQVMNAELSDVTYDSNACRELSQVVAGLIIERLKSFSLTQYKLVCIVSIGSLKDRPAMQFGSRCLWNKETDNFVSVKYTNSSVFAVAMIYGLYFD